MHALFQLLLILFCTVTLYILCLNQLFSVLRIFSPYIYLHRFHTSGKVLEVRDFFLKFPGPGNSWKMSLVLESLGV